MNYLKFHNQGKRNGNPVKKWFVTFPRSHKVSKEDFLVILHKLNLDYYCIALETHQDGEPHLHAIIRLVKGITKPKLKKFFEAEYPNDWKRIHFTPLRSPENALRYCAKEDGCPLISGEFFADQNPSKANQTKLARLFNYSSPEALLDSIKQDKEYLFDLEQKILDHEIWFRQFPDFYEPYYVERAREKLYAGDFVSKDDITLLLNWYKI